MSTEEAPKVVTSEGGDPPPSSNGSKKSSARARAEARRRRILEQGKSRMGFVSGEVVTPKPSSTNDDEEPEKKSISTDAAEAGKESEATEEKLDGGDVSENVEIKPEETVTSPKPSNAQLRYRQMRSRRFKKSSEAPKVEDTSEDTTEQKQDSSEAKKEPIPAPEVKQESTSDKKKYMGVVKMRRKMLAEKKASEEAEHETVDTKVQKSVQGKSATVSVAKKSVAVLPIIFNLLTVLFLFLAGFDVGVQNSISKQHIAHLHSDFGINDHGVGVLSVVGMSKKPSQSIDVIVEEETFISGELESEFDGFEEDELKSKPVGASGASKEANIDPLFGVDLDEFTSGPGVVFALARMAVSIHRMLLYIFLTFTSFVKGTFTTMFAIPLRLMTTPPVLFLSAIFIRYVGKFILGGQLPEFEEIVNNDTGESGAKKDEVGTDVLAMGTNYVKNFFKSTFPNLVLAYTLFKDARSDMFVILSGLFLGLVLPINNLIGTTTGGSEEL